jgi:hypothetical protein
VRKKSEQGTLDDKKLVLVVNCISCNCFLCFNIVVNVKLLYIIFFFTSFLT